MVDKLWTLLIEKFIELKEFTTKKSTFQNLISIKRNDSKKSKFEKELTKYFASCYI